MVQSYEEGIIRDENGSFRTSKNNLSVTYAFKDLGGNIVYEIHNESDDPVFVDWSRSVIITEDYALQLKDNNVRLDGSVNTTTYHFSNSNYSSSTGSISGSVVLPQNDLFVPPHSKVVYSPMALSRVLDLDIPKDLYWTRDVGVSQVKYLIFTEEDTPLKFRSYLTIVNDRDKSQTVFENKFFISEIIRTTSRNNILSGDVMRRSDRFYIEIVNQNAVTVGWIAAGAAIIGGVLLLAPHVDTEVPDFPSF
ncbi:MAG: hypothetical protein BGO34_06355 [Bacteroidia bacterium 44-10]|nr:MAG: hypothetical protein BGO34_06355 [Bacteroidia bacterium 44-10]